MKFSYVLAQEGDLDKAWIKDSDLDESDVVLSRDESQITLEELADICDGNVEQDNDWKGFTGQHRILAQLIFNQFGRVEATKFMLTLAKYGGLSRITFVADLESSYEIYRELGILQPWHNFVINEGAIAS